MAELELRDHVYEDRCWCVNDRTGTAFDRDMCWPCQDSRHNSCSQMRCRCWNNWPGIHGGGAQ